MVTTKDQEKIQQPSQRQGRDHEGAVGPRGQWDNATMTKPEPRLDESTPELYIPLANNPRSPSLTASTTTNANQAAKPMAKPLGRTQTLGQIGRTESFTDVFSTPGSDGSSSATASTPSMLQHRESSAVLNDDDDDYEDRNTAPGIRIDVDGDDELGDGAQPTAESQDVSMGEPQVLSEEQLVLSIRAPTSASEPSSANLTVNTSAKDNAQRFPSPVPTEPEDPDPEYISKQLAKHHIKVRDFAWCPPYTTGAPPPSVPANAANTIPNTPAPAPTPPPQHHTTSTNIRTTDVTSTNTVISHPRVPLIPFTPETFDPYKALGEFEFRLRQSPRTLAIPGKTIRRLIEIGWVTENEVESRCSADDLDGLEEFDSRNRTRLLRLTALHDQREKELGVPAPVTAPTTAENQDTPGTSLLINEGFTSTGAYPYVTLRFESVPTFAEREELANGVRPLFHTVDRVIRMAMAMERERERDRQEAEAALVKRRKEDEERDRAERERVEREVSNMSMDRDEEMREVSSGDVAGGGGTPSTAVSTPSATTGLQPPAEISPSSGAHVTANSRKRSPHQAWADDEDNMEDDIDDLEVKRLRLARSQSETWYEKERRLQQEQQEAQNASDSQPQPQSQPPLGRHDSPSPRPPAHVRPQSQSPHKGVILPSHSRNPSQSQSQHSRSHSRSQSQNQSQSSTFMPPEIQYPAPLAAYDPALYPDAASAIESQSQQSQSQGRRHPYLNNYRGDVATPPASDDEEGAEGNEDGDGKDKGQGKGKSSVMVGRGFGLTEDGEQDTDRPNALKRSPKNGVKRGLTRGRTLVQIC